MDDWTVCRLCLETTAESMKAFMELTYKSKPFGNIFFELLGTTFIDYPSFPGKICLGCENKMIQAYQFKEKCIEVEGKLKELFSDGSQVVSIEFVPISKNIEQPEKVNEDIKLEELSNDTPSNSPITDGIDEIREDPPKPKTSIYNMSQEEIKEMESITIQCSKCKATFQGIEMFKSHSCSLQREKQEESQISEESMEGFDDDTNRREKKSRKIYKCEKCNKILADRNTYGLHMDGHNNVRRYICVYCEKKFRCWTSRRTHIFKEHFKRDYCNCPYCGKGFNTNYNLKIHINADHMEEDTVQPHFGQCEKCGKTFNNPIKLGRHIKTHAGKQKCEICGKWLKNKRSLNVHRKGHNEKKNFTCPVCSKGFTFNYLMKSHVRTSHPKDLHLIPPDSTTVPEVIEESPASDTTKEK